MKKLLIWVSLFGLLAGCQKKQAETEDSYSLMMGRGTKYWEHVKTQEDHDQVAFFKGVFERGQTHEEIASPYIPKTIHFIWVGPKDFPAGSVKNIASWVEKHPDWTFKFWTDRKRELPHPKMELVRIQRGHFETLYDEFLASDNYAEKSDLLRYEILKQEGGVYIDHDVTCYQSIDSLCRQHQLFCGVEPPHKPISSTSISVCNNFIASIPGHPFMENTINKVKDRWSRVYEMYPGRDQESTVLRVFNRTFCPFDESVTEGLGDSEYLNMVYPPAFFNKLEGAFGYFANHDYAGSWYNTEEPYEKLMRQRLMKMSKKLNKILLVSAASVGINLALVGTLIAVVVRRRKHAH